MSSDRIYEFGENSPAPGRLRNLPVEEREVFLKWLTDNGVSLLTVENIPKPDQDFFLQQYYDDWKSFQ